MTLIHGFIFRERTSTKKTSNSSAKDTHYIILYGISPIYTHAQFCQRVNHVMSLFLQSHNPELLGPVIQNNDSQAHANYLLAGAPIKT